VVLLAFTLTLFLLPPVVHALLKHANAPAFLGVEPPTAFALSDALVHDLLFGGTFDAHLRGEVFLGAAERAHLMDVGVLFRALIALGAGALSLLALLAMRRRGLFVQGVRDGAVLLGAGAALVGGAFLFAFDATFAAAHQLLFPAGTWIFNPATDRLVQLYPESFWVAAAIGFCAVLIATALFGFRAAHRWRR
jgi:integral membrane protein (TIGR01906 family)